jgi:hypothetical protein
MRAPAAAFTVALLATAAACARKGAPPVAPVEVVVADLGDAGATIPVASAPSIAIARDRCSARLTADTIRTGAGCTLDERLSKEVGVLLYPCSGSGFVEAVFGEHRFDGSMNDGSMVLNLTTEIDGEDGCHWQTKQRIRGDLPGHGKNEKLAWTYSETPTTGSGCYGSCKATADIDVEESSTR